MMNNTKEELPREGRSSCGGELGEGLLRLYWLWVRSGSDLTVRLADPLSRFPILSFLLWWLVLFIEALVLFPNIEQEGRQQRPF